MAESANGIWQNRIVGYGDVDPESLLASPSNWRIHPTLQQQALAAVLEGVGIVQNILVNRRSSDLWPLGERDVETLVDGHLRVILALRSGQPEIPVTYLDLTPAEEALVLATLDPISAMAVADKEKLDALLREVETGDPALQEMLAGLAKDYGLLQGVDRPTRADAGAGVSASGTADQELDDLASKPCILVTCVSREAQMALVTRLTDEGFECRVLMA